MASSDVTTLAPPPTSREQTEALVLHALHRHGIARSRGFRDESFTGLTMAEIASETSLSRPSVYTIRDMYAAKGRSAVLVGDVGDDGRFRGPLRLRSDLGYAVGVDFGSRHARAALADVHGQLYSGQSRAIEFLLGQPPEVYLDWAANNIRELLDHAGVERAELIGIGTSQVAPINVWTGYPHSKGLTNKAWRDVNVASQLARRLGWGDVSPVSDNDTNLCALAERECGAARDNTDVVYVNWSNHVGFGLIIGGKVYRGSQGYAGELGHRPIPGGTGRCLRCGREGCLEVMVSASGIAEALGAPDDALPTAADYLIERLAEERATGTSTDVFDRMDDATRNVAETVALIVDTLNPQAVILAGALGGKLHNNTALMTTFRSTLDERHMGFADNIQIKEPALGIESAARGAILRVVSEQLPAWAHSRIPSASHK